MGISSVLRCRRFIPALLLVLAHSLTSPLIAQDLGKSLLESAQAWLDGQDGLVAGSHTLEPLDTRVQIPSCTRGFQFSLPHPGRVTVLASCPDTEWTLYLQARAVATSQAPRFAADLPAGHLLSLADIAIQAGTAGESDIIQQLAAGMFLRTAVRAGQSVNQAVLEAAVPAFRAHQSIAAGADLHEALFERILRPVSALPPARQVAAEQLEGARSTRALPAGTIISQADIASKQAVLTAADTIPRGTLLSSDNTEMGYYWGRLPQDAILDMAGLPRATTTSTLLPGQVLRLSTLRIMPPVSKGEAVTVVVKRNLVEISHVMTADQDGQVGQQIDLLNEESGERVRAIVTGVGTARIP